MGSFSKEGRKCSFLFRRGAGWGKLEDAKKRKSDRKLGTAWEKKEKELSRSKSGGAGGYQEDKAA